MCHTDYEDIAKKVYDICTDTSITKEDAIDQVYRILRDAYSSGRVDVSEEILKLMEGDVEK